MVSRTVVSRTVVLRTVVSRTVVLHRSRYANATTFFGASALAGSIITEWGMYTYQSPRATQGNVSPELGFEFVQLLWFAYASKVSAVYFECLMDHPHKSGHTCFFDRYGQPRASYHTVASIATVVRDGYTATRSGTGLLSITSAVANETFAVNGHRVVKSGSVTGSSAETSSTPVAAPGPTTAPASASARAPGDVRGQGGPVPGDAAIVCACGGSPDAGHVGGVAGAYYTLPVDYGVVASSGFAYNGTWLPPMAWMVVQYEPKLFAVF